MLNQVHLLRHEFYEVITNRKQYLIGHLLLRLSNTRSIHLFPQMMADQIAYNW